MSDDYAHTEDRELIPGVVGRIESLTSGETESGLAHGLALPANGITVGSSGIKTFWPGEIVKSAAEMLEGVHLIANHPTDDDVGIEDIRGEVIRSEYVDDVGLLWEGEVDDPDTATLINNGRVDASPYMYRRLGEYDEELEAYVVDEILDVRDLGIVRTGAGESTDIYAGPSPDMQPNVAEALSATFTDADCIMTDNLTEEIESLQETVEQRDGQIEALEADIETLRQPFLEALTAGTEFETGDIHVSTDDLVERFTDDETETLTVAPLTGTESSDEFVEANESTPDVDEGEVEALETRAKLYRRRGMYGHADNLESQLDELTN